MRAWICIIFLLIAVYLLAGSSEHGFITDNQIAASLDKVREEAKDALKATRDFTVETQRKLRDRLESERAEVMAEIKDAKIKVRKASGDEKKALKIRLEKLEKREMSLKKKLEKLGYTDGTFWGRIKEKYHKGINSLKSTWDSFLEWV